MNPILIFIPLSILVIIGFVLINSETVESTYPTYTEASRDGVIPNDTWLPAFLPKSAVEIKEVHNIDTNETWAFFKYAEVDQPNIKQSCTKLPLTEIKLPRADRSASLSWWFDQKSISERKGYEFFLCEDDSYLFLNQLKLQAFFWRLAG